MRSLIILAAATLAGCGGDTSGNETVNAFDNGIAAVEPADVPPPPFPDDDDNEVASVPMPPDASHPQAGTAGDDPRQCGADEYQWLVGQPRSRIPEEPADANWRIACTSCPVTMDYSPARMNIFYDEETEIIEEVKCG